jgi:hypothetical protein
MSVLDRLATTLGRNDEAPNQALAAEIAARGDAAAVDELVAHLRRSDRAIQSDCIKVLYEIGERRPELIAPHAGVFLDTLSSKNNRLVWGAMTALGTIAGQVTDRIWPRIDEVIRANDAGSVITQDWGIRVLTAVAAHDPTYAQRLFPYLLQFLEACIPRDLPKHTESILPAVTAANRDRFLTVLRAREAELKPSQAARLRRVYRALPQIRG